MKKKIEKARIQHALIEVLEIQNDYFFNLIDEINMVENEYHGIKVSTAVTQGYTNILSLFSNFGEFSYIDIFGDNDQYVYLLTRSIFCLHKICDLYGTKDLEIKYSNSLINALLLSKKDISLPYSLFNTMMTYTLSNGEIWFAKYLLDYDGIIWYSNNSYLIMFYVVYLYFLVKKCRSIDENKKKLLDEFLDELPSSINSRGFSWRSSIKKLLNSTSPKFYYDLLRELLKIYDSSSNKHIYTVSPKYALVYSLDDTTTFSEDIIFDVWFEIIAFNKMSFVINEKEKDISIMFNGLSKERLSRLYVRLMDKWITNSGLKENYQLEFLPFIDPNFDTKNYSHVVDEIIDLRNKYEIDNETATIEASKARLKSNDIYKEKLKSSFNEVLKNNMFVVKRNAEEEISCNEKYTNYYFDFEMDAEGLEPLIDSVESMIPYYINSFIGDYIYNSATIFDVSNDYRLKEKMIEKIINFNPDYMSNSSIRWFASQKQLEKINNIKQIDYQGLHSDMYWHKDAIKVDIEYDDNRSIFDSLSDEQVNYIIDNRYKIIDGKYLYNKYTNTDSHSFLVTRDKLFEMLKTSKRYVRISFKAKFDINYDEIYLIKHEN